MKSLLEYRKVIAGVNSRPMGQELQKSEKGLKKTTRWSFYRRSNFPPLKTAANFCMRNGSCIAFISFELFKSQSYQGFSALCREEPAVMHIVVFAQNFKFFSARRNRTLFNLCSNC